VFGGLLLDEQGESRQWLPARLILQHHEPGTVLRWMFAEEDGCNRSAGLIGSHLIDQLVREDVKEIIITQFCARHA
jgi:hypothetical protein